MKFVFEVIVKPPFTVEEYAANWVRAFPADGIADSPQERFTLDLPRVPATGGTLRLRAVDDSGNVAYQSLPLPAR